MNSLPDKAHINDQVKQLIEPYIVEYLGSNIDSRRFLTKSYLKRIIPSIVSRIGRQRTVERVKEAYENTWNNEDFSDFSSTNGRLGSGHYNGQKIRLLKTGPKRIHLFILSEMINALKPESVLEIGCGIGVNIAYLSRVFVNIEFSGLELSESGVDRAKDIIKSPPSELINFYPSPVNQSCNFSRFPNLYCASAEQMPIPDNKYDFVYSVQALEQMNKIRSLVYQEIHRVASHYVCFLEAFREFNRGKQALNIIKSGYFRGTVKELDEYGYEVMEIYDNLPNIEKMNVVCILAKIV